jgi:hypothetical protein
MVVINRRCILLAVINEYYLLDSISAPKTAVDGCEEGPANDKAHIQLTKCFALSDFWWGSLSPARSGPSARGARRVYMIKKIQPQVESYKLQVTSGKLQAIQPVVVWISLIKI